MTLFIIVSLVALAWGAIAHLCFPDRFTWTEAFVQSGISSFVGMLILFAIYHKDMSDISIMNGQVTAKERVKVSCGHSYRCRCYTSCSGSGKSRSCTQHCSTCYEHGYDVDWRVSTSVGNLEIERVNRQGTKEPPRWTAVLIGEPASRTDSYRNWLKASPSSLFAMNEMKNDAVKYKGILPSSYPRVYDYYRYNRVLQLGTSYPQANELNNSLNMELRTLGPAKQVNIITVFVNTTDPLYRYAFERQWLGGKKNDVIVLFGLDKERKFNWVDVITIGKNSGNEYMAVVLRDKVRELSNRQQFGNAQMLTQAITSTVATSFKRKEMKDFEYLKHDYQPSNNAIIGFIIFQIIFLTGMSIFFYNFQLERGDWHSRGTSLLNRMHVPNYSLHRRRY